MKKPFAILLGLAAITGLASTAYAHGNTKPQHGGVVQMNGETLFELVRAPEGISLYVSDEDEPVDASSMTANLSVSADGKRTDIPMTAEEGNRFFAPGVTIAAGSNVGVQVADKASGARYGST